MKNYKMAVHVYDYLVVPLLDRFQSLWFQFPYCLQCFIITLLELNSFMEIMLQ
jgi:hypothetical protein